MANGILIKGDNGDCYNNPVKIGIFNGKPLYKYALTFGNVVANQYVNVGPAGLFTNKTIVSISGCMLQANGSVVVLGMWDPDAANVGFIQTAIGTATVRSSQAIIKGVMVVEYTD